VNSYTSPTRAVKDQNRNTQISS